ncbi:SDR family NAD(P)-dependent oxidoreductase [Paraburkholderia sp. J67]|uniref:SDR family NAD(P)-dependent oxidoreductase n=1 Tax=Paraburkholderia sp. J67 TaxID=2805435 RepID=UPI002ABE8AA3|nr:SDR family NAD(P)-dependent oxidoreductase [Paraburkholderia sp. J67]
MSDLQGKVAIVTGGASGIGRATAQLFAQAGAHVVIADLAEAEARTVALSIEEQGGEALALRVDVTRDEDCAGMVAATLERFGRLDIAFNNAGISGTVAPTDAQGLENWRRIIDVNLGGVFNCMVHELKAMKEQGGSIVNTASIAGVMGLGGLAPYTAAKHGVIGLTRAAAKEYGKQGIRINAVCPGLIATPMTNAGHDPRLARAQEAAMASAIIRRAAHPSEVAEMVVWLASDRASFVTGAHYLVDGGLTA